MPIPIETAVFGDFTMDFFRFGCGKAPLVILPGLSVDSVMRYAQSVANAYQLLAKDFTVFVFDRRKDLPAGYAVRDMARDTAAALAALDLSRACVFGASQGGMIAMQLALDHPEMVQKLALGSTSARVEPPQFRTIARWIALAKAGDAAALYRAFGEALYPADFFRRLQPLLEETAKTVTEGDLCRFAALAGAAEGFDVLDALGQLACPVLVLGAEDDRVLGGEASRAIARAVPRAELFMYDGFGHAAYDLAPDYKERLLRFFAPDGA